MFDGVIPLIIALAAVGVVLYLSYLFSRYLAIGAAKVNESKYIKIIDRIVLGQDRIILIAEIGGKYYLIGSSAQSIQILTELDEKSIEEILLLDKNREKVVFKDKLKGMLARK